MKSRKDSSLFEEKVFESEDENAKTQAACLNRIFRKVRGIGLCANALEELQSDIEHISKIYGLESPGPVLLAAILERSAASHNIDDEDLAVYLGCSNIEFIRFFEMLRNMEKAGIIQSCSIMGGRHVYKVTQETLRAVETDGEFKPVKMTGLDTEELFSRFKKLFDAYKKDSISAEYLLESLDKLVDNNNHLTFCRKALDSALYSECTDTERRMFYYMCQQFISNGSNSEEVRILLNFTAVMENCEGIKRRIAREFLPLQKSGLVCFPIDEGFVDTASLALSDSVKEEFFDSDILPLEESVRNRDIISVETIREKELFYNEQEGAQISRLENLLDVENFKEVQKRLLASGMRKGFNAIFYGAPGTGKTASVYELARRSGRDIFLVDMSKLRSKWVGESEKSVRGLFKIYRALCKSSEKTPILLFNEADAIFTKRIENIEQSIDQLNNSIQNIILEEMEYIDGILIATTNLLSNLDPAFERRFIFKVEFRMPERESRAKIWKSMIPGLSEEDADTLAGSYDFSGGNIENVARKSTVEYVLSGNVPTLASLDAFCQEEILNRQGRRNRIGF